MKPVYDIFLSYSRRDLDWVSSALLRPLLCAQRRDGGNLRVFFDLNAIEPSDAWRRVVTNAIQRCKHFIPIYSKQYFKSKFCTWELDLAQGRDLDATKRLILPVNLDACSVPFAYSLIQFVPASAPDWFDRLCARLHARPGPVEARPAEGPARRLEYLQLLAECRALEESCDGAIDLRVRLGRIGETEEPHATAASAGAAAGASRGSASGLRVGEKVELCLTSNRAGYAYVLWIESSENASLVFPNRYAPDNQVVASEPMLIPGASDKFDLRLTGGGGRELVQVLVADRPIEHLQTRRSPRAGGDHGSVPALTREIQMLQAALRSGPERPSAACRTLTLEVRP